MGKGHNNNKNQRKDPMTNARTMRTEGMRIIRDIAFGKFNNYNDGHVFRNLDFVRATLTEVDKRLMDAQIHVTAIIASYGANPVNPDVANLLFRDQRTVSAYMIIRTTLCNIIMSNGDTGFLEVLTAQLPPYKYNI